MSTPAHAQRQAQGAGTFTQNQRATGVTPQAANRSVCTNSTKRGRFVTHTATSAASLASRFFTGKRKRSKLGIVG